MIRNRLHLFWRSRDSHGRLYRISEGSRISEIPSISPYVSYGEKCRELALPESKGNVIFPNKPIIIEFWIVTRLISPRLFCFRNRDLYGQAKRGASRYNPGVFLSRRIISTEKHPKMAHVSIIWTIRPGDIPTLRDAKRPVRFKSYVRIEDGRIPRYRAASALGIRRLIAL